MPVDEHGKGINIKDQTGNNIPTVNRNNKPVLPSDPITGLPIQPIISDLFNNQEVVLPKNEAGDEIVPVDKNNNNIIPRNPDTGEVLPPKDSDGNPLIIVDALGRMIQKTDDLGKPINPVGNILNFN